MTDTLPGILEQACKKVRGVTYCMEDRTDRFGTEYEWIGFRWDGQILSNPETCWIATTRQIIEDRIEHPDSIVRTLLDEVDEVRAQAEQAAVVLKRRDELLAAQETGRKDAEAEAGLLAEVRAHADALALPDGTVAVGYRTFTDDGVLGSFIKIDGPDGSRITPLEKLE